MTYPVHAHIKGPIVIIGFGSIGRGTLPLIERHFEYDAHLLHVIEPSDEYANFMRQRGVNHIHMALTKENYRQVLGDIFAGTKGGFCVNLSVDTDSLDIMKLCREMGVLYLDTVTEPWPGFYGNENLSPARKYQLCNARAGIGRKAAQSGRANGGLLLRGKSGNGFMAGQGSAA